MSTFLIDGTSYNVGTISVKRVPVYDRTELGTTLDGFKHYKTSGVYFNYEISIATRQMDVQTYDSLYEVLTDGLTHQVTLPYAQTTISVNALLTAGDDSLMRNFVMLKRWGTLNIKIESLEHTKEVN